MSDLLQNKNNKFEMVAQYLHNELESFRTVYNELEMKNNELFLKYCNLIEKIPDLEKQIQELNLKNTTFKSKNNKLQNDIHDDSTWYN
jgi:cell division protein FtsB